ncbi:MULTISPECIES: GNAT family N-acetyltransferase [unclassified Nitrobacter]|uniref:GNAT family N-acetyltransferase n=1 Tax=unclassified Nitrobacter TaxID=2620411 RepID=UPI0003212DFA|nr:MULTISPECIES: GNAT family N-acetyltransferase [unclassified Nitrobacter]MCB1394008.1 GNAT family N-acetyltransferase [Nitrobacter sp.]MCV0387283.1 GNAT family N-acetyltransferase [Nitrobacter sp.]
MAKIPPEHDGCQHNPVTIRQAKDGDLEDIIKLVEDVVAETYGHLFEEIPPVPIDRPWIRCWVAETEGQIVGIGLAIRDWITDMWVRPQFRSIGVGTALLDRLEAQVVKNRYATARLRVVSNNKAAFRFYLRHGWRASTRCPHESWDFEMINMVKDFNMSGSI